MPFPLAPFDSSLSIASTHAPPRTDHQAMPFPHNGPTSEPNKYKSTRTSPTTDRSCLGTPFDSSVLTPPQMHLRRQTIFRDFPNVSLHFSMVLLDSSMVLFNCSVVLLDFSMVLLMVLLGFSIVFSIVFPLFFHVFSMVLLVFSIILPFHSSLPKCTSEDGPGGNRYPTVTQLPPGTSLWRALPPGPPITHFVRKRNFA